MENISKENDHQEDQQDDQQQHQEQQQLTKSQEMIKKINDDNEIIEKEKDNENNAASAAPIVKHIIGKNNQLIENTNDGIPLLECYEGDIITIICDLDSPFDRTLRKRWNDAFKQGVINYNFDCLPTKIISPDKYKFVVTLVEGRGPGKRRSPEEMHSLQMPFNSEKFNFTKVDPKEILFRIKYTNNEMDLQLDSLIVVNKSPIGFCSSLMVPLIHHCLPQVLNEHSLLMAVFIVALSDFQSLRLGYNSLGSMASVNHLHWHVFYLPHRLLIEDLPVLDYVLQDWPIPALVFEINELNDDYISVILKDTMRIVEFCLEDGQICHNLFVTRTSFGSIRIFLWLLEPRWGQKDNSDINVGFCELSGYFICKTLNTFDLIDEDRCLDALKEIKTTHDKVLHLLQ